MFDHFKITVQSGKGGDGAIAFRHEKSVAKGGPYGGNGGRGGSVYLVASRNVESLAAFNFRQHFFATDGENGKSKLCNGRDGKDVVVQVPIGTVVTDENGNFVADLNFDGDKICVARGGRGGRGNASFKSPTRRTPNISENGAQGQRAVFGLELRLMADAGLIGFPNAGKSSLLANLTNAKTLVASYKFSTIDPVLGVYNRNLAVDRFVLADIPGLIEGASEGRGMGFEFLRHLLRCRVLVHCIDPTDEEHPDLEEAFLTINDEIQKYSENLSTKKQIVVFTKMDLVEDYSKIEAFEKKFGKIYTIYRTSTEDMDSLENLAKAISELVKEEKKNDRTSWLSDDGEEKVYAAGDIDSAAIPEYQIVQNEEGSYEILGDRVIRTKRLINLSTDEGLDRLIAYLDRIGVNKRLEEMKVPAGSTVSLDGFEFEYQP